MLRWITALVLMLIQFVRSLDAWCLEDVRAPLQPNDAKGDRAVPCPAEAADKSADHRIEQRRDLESNAACI